MSHVPFEPVEATVQGSARGRDIAGRWHVSVTTASLALMSPHSPERASFTFAVAELEGAGMSEETLTLYLARGESLTFRDSHRLGELSLRLDALCHEVGEVMRASRAAGSRRAGAGSEHDRFFAPFLAARLQLAEAADARARLDAANARELRSAVTGVVTHFAASRFPDDAADRRALLAELEEYLAPLMQSLDRLEDAAGGVREAAPERRFAEWRRWRTTLAECYVHAERAWTDAVPALGALPQAEQGRGRTNPRGRRTSR